ncbi:MAG TPA: zinc ABC transporter substrate-binding protein [Thermoanaerobaculia bacterium]
MNGPRLRAAALFATAALLAACRTEAPAADGRLQVAVSVPPQAYVVERIGGPRVAVTVMMAPGQPDEEVTVSPRRLLALGEARLYVRVGHPAFAFERRAIDPFLAQLPAVQVVDLASAGPRRAKTVPETADGGSGDPHLWVAPENVAAGARATAAALARLDPPHAAEYAANLARFLADVAALDRELRVRVARLPRERRGFLVYHAAWGHFARQYGLTQIAVEAEGKEPSAARLIELIERARRGGFHLLFVEPGFPRRSARVIADAVDGRMVVADASAYDWLQNLRTVAAGLGEAG